jgi:hypothetical protein
MGTSTGSAPLFNPYTTVADQNGNIVSRQPFPGNRIPANLLNPVALQIAKAVLPAPNYFSVSGVNFLNSLSNTNTSNQWNGRVDHQFSPKDTFYARYSDWKYDIQSRSRFHFTTVLRHVNGPLIPTASVQ